MRNISAQSGFSLVELMISLLLAGVVVSSLIQIFVSHSVTAKLNRALAYTQESGRFVIDRLRHDTLTSGGYDIWSQPLNNTYDSTIEAGFIHRHPVLLPNTLASWPSLGSSEGNHDVLVVVGQARQDCRGYSLGYSSGELFPVVNEYYLADNSLRCRGYDLRVLQGYRSAVGHNNHNAVTLAEDVMDWQVLYGIADENSAGQAVQYLKANQLTTTSHVVTLRIALLLRSENELNIQVQRPIKLLDNTAYTPTDGYLYRQFETTILLRNLKYHITGESV